jgi:hypothetical protein
MKKKLLYLTSIMLFSAFTSSAQIKYIDLGGYTIGASGFTSLATVSDINLALYGSTTYQSGSKVYDGAIKIIGTNAPYQLSVIGGSDTSGRLYTTVANQTGYGTSVGTAPSLGGEFGATFARIQPNGAGSTSRRQLQVSVLAGQTVTCILHSDNVAPSIAYITTTNTTPTIVTDPAFTQLVDFAFKIKNTGGVSETYTFWEPLGKLSLFRVYFDDVTLSYTLDAKSFQKQSITDVISTAGKISVLNVTSSTQIDVYSISGSLVKTTNTNTDTTLDVNSGAYIVKVKSADSEKSVKIIVK